MKIRAYLGGLSPTMTGEADPSLVVGMCISKTMMGGGLWTLHDQMGEVKERVVVVYCLR